MNFMDSLKKTLGDKFNSSVTENGALGYRTTGKKLLDLNFAVSSLRNLSEEEVVVRFAEAYYENPLLAIKWLFFASDIREGLGERRLFRICLKFLVTRSPKIVKQLLVLIPEYNRWDNLLCLLDTSIADDVVILLQNQLTKDMEQAQQNQPISLCAKWMPSANASSKETKRLAKVLIEKLKITERQYRKMLSTLRERLHLVETSMSKKEWSQIVYEAVPARANLIYNKAFLRNDEERRRSYLESLEKGETKINAGVLYPHDIVHKYLIGTYYQFHVAPFDSGLEELWKALPVPVKEAKNTLCVADGSGSMISPVGKTQIRCLDVANALAIYFSEHCSGQFKDKYITFSMSPEFVDFSNAQSLREKIEIALHYNEVANTNIEAVFDLILETATSNHMSAEDMPQTILILSDMEFDTATYIRDVSHHFQKPSAALFEELQRRYLEAGYSLPRLVFWNLCSRTQTIPLTQNNCGVALVSGFSVQTLKMVCSGELDPYRCLLEQLNTKRYQPVEEAFLKASNTDK